MPKNQKYGIDYQLGAYYDMRYMQYFTRFKFILGLSKYNEDDTAPEREEEMKVTGEEFTNFSILDWQVQKTKIEQGKSDGDGDFVELTKMAMYIKENDPLDKVVDEYLLNTYDNIDEQEFQVCKWIIWTLWDISEPLYCEVVCRILISDEEKQSKIFSNINEVEDTIQRLIRKGILFQVIDYTCDLDENGNRRKKFDEPHVLIPFMNDPDEALRAICEIWGQTVKSFFVPHTNYKQAA